MLLLLVLRILTHSTWTTPMPLSNICSHQSCVFNYFSSTSIKLEKESFWNEVVGVFHCYHQIKLLAQILYLDKKKKKFNLRQKGTHLSIFNKRKIVGGFTQNSQNNYTFKLQNNLYLQLFPMLMEHPALLQEFKFKYENVLNHPSLYLKQSYFRSFLFKLFHFV